MSLEILLEHTGCHIVAITIEVDEWKDENGNPSVFYSEPLTLEEKNIIFKKSSNFQDLTVLVDLLIMKLQVKNDKGEHIKAFKPVEPYKAKGIKERNQFILRKEGKKK